jgi:hypothetical protein
MMKLQSRNARNSAIIPVSSILDIDQSEYDEETIAPVKAIIEDLFTHADTIFLSHEFLFSKMSSIINIARFSSSLADSVMVLGYCRRQSDFIKSAYGQWHFRSLDRTKEVCDALIDNNFDPIQFSGIERFLVAAIITEMDTARQLSGDKIFHWGPRYKHLRDSLDSYGVEISVGVMPTKMNRFSLIDDFYKRSGIERGGTDNSTDTVANLQFNPDLIEAVNIAVMYGMDVPGPHEHNDLIRSINLEGSETNPKDALFLERLEAFVDTNFWLENQEFCRQFGLQEDYFRPKIEISKQSIESIIKSEYQCRLDNPIHSAQRNGRVVALITQELFKSMQK